MLQAEVDTVFRVADNNARPIARGIAGSAGVIRAWRVHKGVLTYLGDLTNPAKVVTAIETLISGESRTVCQKSDCFIVVMKPLKEGGMKGAANSCFRSGNIRSTGG